MKRFILLLGVLLLAPATKAQLRVVANRIVVDHYDPVRGKYTEQSNQPDRVFITWRQGELNIVCGRCTPPHGRYVVRARVREDVPMGGGVTIDEYQVLDAATGLPHVVLVGYSYGRLANLSISRGRVMVIFSDLEDY